MSVELFDIQTADRATSLHGEIVLPERCSDATPALLIVPGGWFMDRDGFTGDSGTDADLMYRRIGERVVREGFAVARYDNRGVTGNEITTGNFCRAEDDCWERTEKYLRDCIDFKVRRTVTPETGLNDVSQVYDFVQQHPKVDASRIVIFAHSEGGLNVARLIGCKRILPCALVFMGVITESPVAIVVWQAVDAQVDQVMRWDQNSDEFLSRSEIAAGYARQPLFSEVGRLLEELAPEEGWSRSALTLFFQQRYETMKTDALGTDDASPYPAQKDGREFVAACYRWWKQWFTDDVPTIDLLRDYSGPVAFHFGELDSQVPANREIAFAADRPMPRQPKMVLHPSRGHCLRSAEPLSGPMDADAENLIVAEITAPLKMA